MPLVLCAQALVGIIAAVWPVESWKRKAVHGDYGGEGEHDTFFDVSTPSSQRLSLSDIAPVGIPLALTAAWVFIRFFPPAVA